MSLIEELDSYLKPRADAALQRPIDLPSLRRVFLLLTRFHFSFPENYGDLKPYMADLQYSEDVEGRTLDVELLAAFNRTKALFRPGVYVGFSGIKFRKLVVGNTAGMSQDTSRIDGTSGASTSLALLCRHDNADLSLTLAQSICDFFTGVGPHLRCALNLTLFDPQEIKDTVMAETSPERRFDTVVFFNLAFNYTVSTFIESHRIKKFALEVNPIFAHA